MSLFGSRLIKSRAEIMSKSIFHTLKTAARSSVNDVETRKGVKALKRNRFFIKNIHEFLCRLPEFDR
jgi:hypothetical protein